MKKLQISDKEFIRADELRYNLTDLFRLTTLSGIRLEPWGWAQSENRTRDISRRGWFFKKSWAKSSVLIEYANYLSHHLYRDVLRALEMDDPAKLIAVFGENKAARLDYRVGEYLAKRDEDRKAASRRIDEGLGEKLVKDPAAEPLPDLTNVPRFDAKVLPQPARKDPRAEAMQRAMNRPTRSMSHSRSMGASVQHHRSEPDYLTQALVMQTVLSSDNSYSSHSRSDDTCHSSSSSSSWSGDSGGSYDSGGSGGCD